MFHAVYATKANQTRYTEVVDGKVVLRKAPANTSAEQIKSIPADKLIVQATTRQSGAIFVTPTDVRQMLEANGVFIDRRAMIQLGAPITAPGIHTVKIDGTDVTVQVVGRPLPRYN
jgi:ribosomal protein L9